MSLPAADDLFRPTVVPNPEELTAADPPVEQDAELAAPEAADPPVDKPRQPSGRVRHDEKMTVYVTSDELLDLEHARLTLRRHHGLAVDRGRIVRAAVALALADLDANGDQSVIVQRLSET